jgi:hypothetical protein
MKKKHKHKFRHRNAAPPRNIIARSPRAPKQADESALNRLGYTAAGAAGTALVGSILARQGWAPKTVATALTAVGAGLAWKGDGTTVRNLGAGTMSAAGSQLALMMIDDHDKRAAPSVKVVTAPPPPTTKKPSNAEALPAGALESAFERARQRLALATGEPID